MAISITSGCRASVSGSRFLWLLTVVRFALLVEEADCKRVRSLASMQPEDSLASASWSHDSVIVAFREAAS